MWFGLALDWVLLTQTEPVYLTVYCWVWSTDVWFGGLKLYIERGVYTLVENAVFPGVFPT